MGGGSGRGNRRGSPYNHPPLDEHRLNTEKSEIGQKGIELKARAQMRHGLLVLGVELCYLLWCVVEILQVFPGISLYPIAFPLDQVLEFPLEHPTVQDLFHNASGNRNLALSVFECL